jgi:hypothetical protein
MRFRTHALLLLSVACLLTACTTNHTAHRKAPAKWKSALTAAIRTDDVEGVTGATLRWSSPAGAAIWTLPGS